jgi:hypothetical protein
MYICMYACMYVCVYVYMYMRREEDAAEKIYRSVLDTDPGAVEGKGGRAGGRAGSPPRAARPQRDLAKLTYVYV